MTKIDGRKAKILNWKEAYPLYKTFAEKHGYPNAVRTKEEYYRGEKTPKDGDIVTLLAGGSAFETEGAYLWIVEDENKVQHIIDKKGLDILDTDLNNTVTINGITYLKVERNAKKGEKVLVIGVAPQSTKVGHVSVGEVLTVESVDNASGDIIGVEGKDIVGVLSRDWDDFGCEYVVLEPLQGEILVEKPKEESQQNELAEYVASLEARITRLEQLLLTQEEERVETEEDFVEELVKEPLTRDEIIEKAKTDVDHLIDIGKTNCLELPNPNSNAYGFFYNVEFVVDRKKGIVVALVKTMTNRKEVLCRGISKCSKDDAFNVHIGKAIALNRALELDVPVEYLNVPQPTEPQAGDEITWWDGFRFRVTKVDGWYYSFYSYQGNYPINGLEYKGGIADKCKVIDDSRDGRFGEFYVEIN